MPRNHTKIERVCRYCGTTFFVIPSVAATGRGVYCSRPCYFHADPVDRFWSYVDKSGGPDACWLWTGALDKGYGVFWLNPKKIAAHRFSYELALGPIPEGLEIDHVRARGCTHRNCVNPAHLEIVTSRVNVHRSSSPAAINARKTQCIHGHEFTPENTYYFPSGARACRTCRREWKARRRNL